MGEYGVRTAMCAGQLKPQVERQCNLTACERYSYLPVLYVYFTGLWLCHMRLEKRTRQ